MSDKILCVYIWVVSLWIYTNGIKYMQKSTLFYLYIQHLIYTENNHILSKFKTPELLVIINDYGHHQYYHF